MAIKALKQSVSISETQKMIHQWKAKGITDSATLKLLDLYLGLTPYMTAEGIYPMRNLYQICQSMKTTHTTTLLENIRKCCSFGLIWNENRTHPIVMVLMPLAVFLWGQNATFWKELCGYVMVLDVKLILEGVSASNSPNYIPE